MQTLSRALNQDDDWQLDVRLASRRIYRFWDKDEKRLRAVLSLAVMDGKGNLVEIKTWSIQQAHYIYKLVKTNQNYIINGSRPFSNTNLNYTSAKFETISGWHLESYRGNFEPSRYLPCSTSIEAAANFVQKVRAANVYATFLSYAQGPGARYVGGRATVQGYFIDLVDEAGYIFHALVWHHTRLDKKNFDLFNCDYGDQILLVAARRSASNESGRKKFCLTTLYPPVINSSCISPECKNDLKQSFESMSKSEMKTYYKT